MKDIFIWNLSRGRKLEKFFNVTRNVFLALQFVLTVLYAIIRIYITVDFAIFAIIFAVLFVLYYASLIAEMSMWRRNTKCEELSSIKHRLETPKNSIQAVTYINDTRVKMDIGGNTRLADVARVSKLDFANASFAVAGDSYIGEVDPDMTIAEMVGEHARVIVLSADGDNQNKTEIL